MSIDEVHIGPIADFEEMCKILGPEHPYNAIDDEVLVWYDGPIYSIVHVAGDPRPRLDLHVDETSEGENDTRIFMSVRHQLVFDRMDTLRATLRDGCPTRESYRLAEHIVRYRTRCTRIGHPSPSHELWASRMTMADVPADELPTPGEPEGLSVPSLDHPDKVDSNDQEQ